MLNGRCPTPFSSAQRKNRRLRAPYWRGYPGRPGSHGPPGHLMRPQEIGVLAALGVSQVQVHRRPRVGVLSTGDELIDVDAPLTRRAKFATATAMPRQHRCWPLARISFPWAWPATPKIMCAPSCVLDLKQALIFWSVPPVFQSALMMSSRPFWNKRAMSDFGGYACAPANHSPLVLTMACHFSGFPAILYRPWFPLNVLSGPAFARWPVIPIWNGPDHGHVQEELTSDGRESYVRACVTRYCATGYQAVSTGSQGSHVMTSLVKANALMIIPEGVTKVSPGDQLQAMMIDWPEIVF